MFAKETAVWMLTMEGSKLVEVVLLDKASNEVLTLLYRERLRIGRRYIRRMGRFIGGGSQLPTGVEGVLREA